MAIVIPTNSTQKITLLCAEAKSIRDSISNLGSSALKFDNAIQNTLNTVIDVCNQFDNAIELAKSAGDTILEAINGITPQAQKVATFINQGSTKLPTLPLPISVDIGDIIGQITNVEFEQINTDMLFSQLGQFAPAGFEGLTKQLDRIPDNLKSQADLDVSNLAKGLNFNSILNSTKKNINKKAVTCIMTSMKEKNANINKLLAGDTKNIMKNITDNLTKATEGLGGGGLTEALGGGGLIGTPFEVEDIPGLNSDSTNLLTLAGNLTGVSSALFYIEMACEIAKVANTTISTVNDLMNRYQNIMPSDESLNARLDKLVRNQANEFLKQISGLNISELEQLQIECSQLATSNG